MARRAIWRKSTAETAERGPIETAIHIIRGERIILDADLAALYGVQTKVLNKAYKRNRDRFPQDFVFQLNRQEVRRLRFQFGTSNDRSPRGRGGRRYLPYAFTEHGAIMAAGYDAQFKVVFDAIRALMEPAPAREKRRIGFRAQMLAASSERA